MTIDDIQNGVWWEAPHPLCLRATSQWIDEDQWILLGEESPADHGGTCRVAFSTLIPDVGMVVIHTKEQLLHRLSSRGWVKAKGGGENT